MQSGALLDVDFGMQLGEVSRKETVTIQAYQKRFAHDAQQTLSLVVPSWLVGILEIKDRYNENAG